MSDGEHKCPECGGAFPTKRGMRSHYGQVHKGSIAGTEVRCKACGGVFLVPQIEPDRKYCSRDCMKTKVTTACAACGDLLERIPSRVEKHEQQFCDQECAGEWRSGRPNELLQVQRIEKPCSWCGDAVFRRPSHPDVENWFCDDVCYGKYISEHNVGEDNPNWEGGYPKYGKGWSYPKKRSVRIRDQARCQHCGRTESEHLAEFGSKHVVHHITPARELDDPEERNAMGNLITLCRGGCHHTWEQMAPLRPASAD